MKRFILIILTTFFCSLCSIVKCQDSIDDYRQHTTWGFATGVNMLNYSLNLESAVGAPDRAAPGLGAEMGLFLDYHISEPWAFRFAPSVGMEHINLYKGDDDGHLFTFALELGMALGYTINHKLSTINFNFGPYSHFVLASTLYGSENLTNPYSRTNTSDPVTEEPSFAIGDLSAGIALSVAYQLPSLWFFQMDLKYGITDMLNADSHRLYVRPFKAVISIGRRIE